MRMIAHMIPVLLWALCSCCEKDYTQYVNPLIGTDYHRNLHRGLSVSEERGQTMPAVGVPNGMTNWVAQTIAGENKCNSPYYYYHTTIQGFRASHWLPGSCAQDYGSVTIMPLSGELKTVPEERASDFSHDNERSTPYYYRVKLDNYNICAEISGLSRAGIFSFDFQSEEDRYIVVEPNSDKGRGYIEIDAQKGEIRGYNPAHRIYQGWGETAGFSGYFVIRIQGGFEEFGTWCGNDLQIANSAIKGNREKVGGWIKLPSSTSGSVLVKIGTSFTSIENAALNLDTEIPEWNFDKVVRQSKKAWNDALSKVEVRGDDSKQLEQFYTALYNTRLVPRTFSDVDGSYPGFSQYYVTHQAEDFIYYCDFSMWDTHRAVQPLNTLLHPTMNGHMMRSYVIKGQTGGWLPIFPMWNNYTAAMIGDHGLSVIGDAIMKDIPGFDYEDAYELMRKNAFEANTDRQSYVDGKGRRAMESYLQYGYIPLEDEVLDAFHKREQVSRTLEYAYDDYVLSRVAQKLGKTEDYEILNKRAQNYRHVIDTLTGYARGRHADGRWIEPFEPNDFASFICEGTPFHYTWYVPHDVEGLRELLGKQRFGECLDEFFENGYYWHGNEPGHHIAYLYSMTGQAWKTQKLVHEIADREYAAAPYGLSGNDDAGQMSAWLVFAKMGFYPVCPGTNRYVIGSPGFEKITLTLENGKQFVISTENYSTDNIYIQSARLNGQAYEKYYLTHQDIMNGGRFDLKMGPGPNLNWPAVTSEAR